MLNSKMYRYYCLNVSNSGPSAHKRKNLTKNSMMNQVFGDVFFFFFFLENWVGG